MDWANSLVSFAPTGVLQLLNIRCEMLFRTMVKQNKLGLVNILYDLLIVKLNTWGKKTLQVLTFQKGLVIVNFLHCIKHLLRKPI